MVPKIIHYCWFGERKLPDLAKKCINSWQKFLPEYEIKCWSEENFDISNSVYYVREAYERKKYAFVSDYVRLYALYNYGGIYLDTDVEVIKDFTPLFRGKTILGYENDESISTAFMMVPPKARWIENILKLYESRHFITENGVMDVTTNVAFISEYLRNRGVKLNGKLLMDEYMEIYPVEFFSPRSWDNGRYNITENTYIIHYFAGTWHSVYSKILSHFFSNAQVAKIAGLKDKFRSILVAKKR